MDFVAVTNFMNYFSAGAVLIAGGTIGVCIVMSILYDLILAGREKIATSSHLYKQKCEEVEGLKKEIKSLHVCLEISMSQTEAERKTVEIERKLRTQPPSGPVCTSTGGW